MPYLNLKAEMAKRNVTIEAIADYLGIHRNSVSYKINRGGSFSIEESMDIRKRFFPDLTLDYIFAKENKTHVR